MESNFITFSLLLKELEFGIDLGCVIDAPDGKDVIVREISSVKYTTDNQVEIRIVGEYLWNRQYTMNLLSPLKR
ncbi:hypothetical protein AT268_31570 [Bacillus cereus]|uniref:Uncharacterized protein n=1 Tax=Bacillus cereus TaxID=1396 RepID=A0A9X0MJP4_BACCE|nr:hypothetical protein [Bacillus cereus]KXY51046.1 hypothetical protein AT268_31570 [Bacillus cereus]